MHRQQRPSSDNNHPCPATGDTNLPCSRRTDLCVPDHCINVAHGETFLHCGPSREATFTIGQLRTLIGQVKQLGTVNTVYFEGGEPFLFYPLLLEGLRMVRAAGFEAGIVTNGYRATSVEDGLHWLRPIRDLGIADFSVSDDEFHRLDKNDRRPEFARQAAQQLGIPTGTICIEPPSVSRQIAEGGRGKPVVGGSVRFKGRAAEKLTAGLPVRLREELTTCPHEDLLSPERVHVDAHGNVHLCQGLSMGNIWERKLLDLVRGYDAQGHPIVGPLLRGGPIRLATEHGLAMSDGYVDECHLLHGAEAPLAAFPAISGTQGSVRALARAGRCCGARRREPYGIEHIGTPEAGGGSADSDLDAFLDGGRPYGVRLI